jgi:hypothetical protein
VLFGMRDILPAKSPGRSCLSASEADSTASARRYHRSCPPPAAPRRLARHNDFERVSWAPVRP